MASRVFVRKEILYPCAVVSTVVLTVGEARWIPKPPKPLDLDMNQHNRHLLPALLISAGVTYAAGLCGASRRAMRTIGASTTALFGGVFFELGMFNAVYANNPSIADGICTAALAGVGSFCIASSQKSDTLTNTPDNQPNLNNE